MILKFPTHIEEERRRAAADFLRNCIESLSAEQTEDALGTIWEYLSKAREREAKPTPDNVTQIGIRG